MNTIAKLFLILVFSFVSDNTYALRSTDTESFTDPDYRGYVPSKVVLIVDNASNSVRKEIEIKTKRELEKAGVSVVFYRDIFPPTREWTVEEQNDVFIRDAIDSGIVITFGTRSKSVRDVGTQTFGSANFNSYGGSGSATSVKLKREKSVAEFNAVMIDLKSNKTAWYVDITTKAGGALFVGEKQDARAAVNGIIDELRKNGHLPKNNKNR